MKADFDKNALEVIWGQYPRCVITGIHGNRPMGNMPIEFSICDFNHVIGRNKDDKVYSSVYNSAAILRIVHVQFSVVNNRYIRMFQLERVREIVQTAIREGRYEETDIDVSFVHEILPQWEAVQFPV